MRSAVDCERGELALAGGELRFVKQSRRVGKPSGVNAGADCFLIERMFPTEDKPRSGESIVLDDGEILLAVSGVIIYHQAEHRRKADFSSAPREIR